VNDRGASARYVAYALVAATLIGLNTWYWWPNSEPTGKPTRQAPAVEGLPYRSTDFRVRQPASPKPSPQANARDLFRPAATAHSTTGMARAAPRPSAKERKQAAARRAAAQRAVARQHATEHTAAQREASRQVLNQFKLVGILVRSEGREAYLIKDEGAYIVHLGDLIAQRYRVDDVSLNAVRLTDTATQVSTTLPVAGN